MMGIKKISFKFSSVQFILSVMTNDTVIRRDFSLFINHCLRSDLINMDIEMLQRNNMMSSGNTAKKGLHEKYQF